MISLVVVLILAAFFGFMSFVFYTDNKPKLGAWYAAMVFLIVIAGAMTYPLVRSWQAASKAADDSMYAKTMITAYGSAENYIKYLEASKCE